MRCAADFDPTGKSTDRFCKCHIVRSAQASAKAVARNGEFRKPIQNDPGGRISSSKKFSLRKSELMHDVRVPLLQRGASRSSRNVGRDAMDVLAQLTNAADTDGEGVWSWSPDAGINP
jgi:hypothetical protein